VKTDHITLLAPAGSLSCVRAAGMAGANAVYFGVEQLNMRARSADYLTLDDIPEVVSVSREFGMKSYLTLNTVMYTHDMQLMRTIADRAKSCGVDALIASDFSVIAYGKEIGIPVHISTQANVSNVDALAFFAPYAETVVLARELTLKQVKEISREIARRKITGMSGELIKLEIFVHGALCMAVSGKCYLSLHASNSSANRGACKQQCRRPYKVTDIETQEELIIDHEYIMSPKDLCTIDFLDQIIESGACVLKIEGRSKDADYVYTVVKCYREALDALADNTYGAEKIKGWLKTLKTVYNRGFWDGYYLGRRLGEWTPHPGTAATERKILAGRGVRFYPKIQVGEYILENSGAKAGDSFMVIGPNCGVSRIQPEILVVNGYESAEAKRGDHLTFPVSWKVTPADKLYKLVDA
jgi:putative protease